MHYKYLDNARIINKYIEGVTNLGSSQNNICYIFLLLQGFQHHPHSLESLRGRI